MDIMPLYLVFLQSMPENAILVSLGLVLIGIKPRFIPILLIAIITALSCYFIRALPLPPGLHILMQLPIMILLITYILEIPLTFAILASFLGLICIASTEIVFNSLISMFTGVSVMEAIKNPLWRVLFPIPEFIFLTVVTLVMNYYEKSIFNIPDLNETERVMKNEES